MAPSFPLPAELPLDAVSEDQTSLVVRPWVVQLRAIIQHQEARIGALDAPARSQRQGPVLDHLATMLGRVSSRLQEG